MRTETPRLGLVLASLFLLALFISRPAAAEDEAKGKPVAAKENKVLAIVGGDVHTITHEVIQGGTVLVKDGKIFKVGQDIPIPEGARVIDARGKHVTPGYVVLSMAGVGLRGAGAAQGGGRGGGGRGGAGATSRIADALDPFDRNMKFCLGVGITTGCVEMAGGGGGRRGGRGEMEEPDETQVCPCCGLAILPTQPIGPALPTAPTVRRNVVLKMSFGDLETMLVKEEPFHHLPGTGLAGPLNHYNWRENLRQARKYLDDLAAHEKAVKAGEDSRPPRKPVSDDLIELAKKSIPLRTDAATVSQIRDMIKLAKELDYRLVLEDPTEAWLIPQELAEAKVSVVLTPRNRRQASPGKPDTSGSSIETSALLEKAGVPFAVVPQRNTVSLDGVYGGRDLTGLPLEAAFAVRGGCTEKAALEALTIVPARMLGLESRIGSIDEGKDADLLILDGPPLDYRTAVQTVLIGGKVYYEAKQDKIYPDVERKR